MIEVLVYGISLKSGGGLSVLKDFYTEALARKSEYPNVRWHFALSTQKFENSGNIVVWNVPDSTKSWFHRIYHNLFLLNKYVKKNNISVVISLQSMQAIGCRIPSMICLHNVLPLYKCDSQVLESTTQRIKQTIINRGIVNSIKKAKKTFVPSDWIAEKLINEKGIVPEKIVVSRMNIPEIEEQYIRTPSERYLSDKGVEFFYPASCFPYKNHRVIVKACEILNAEGINNYSVQFTFSPNQNKTANTLAKEIEDNKLNISMSGPISRDEVMGSYKKKVLIFPSKIENDAVPIIESMQCAGAIISARLPYAEDLLKEYRDGYLFDADDANELALFMKQIIKNGVDFHEKSSQVFRQNGQCRVDMVVESLMEMMS